ncbi:MAG: hypothetical protein V7661_12795 [Sulfitobacter sp.]
MKGNSNSELNHTMFLCFIIAVFLGLPLFFTLQASGFFIEFRELELNEKGDALAGIFGTLAFAAAAIAVFMQSSELRAQREELKLTRMVMSEQKKATQEMAQSMAVQADIFLEEQKQRSENSFDQILEEKAQFVLDLINFYRSQLKFEFEVNDCGLISRAGLVELTDEDPTQGYLFLFAEKDHLLGVEAATQKLAKDLYFVKWSIAKINKADFEIKTKPINSERLIEIISVLSDLVNLRDNLSEAGRTRFDRLRIARVSEYLNEIAVHPLWVSVDE